MRFPPVAARPRPPGAAMPAGNNIYTTTFTLAGKVPVIRYVCLDCGYVENWVDNAADLAKLAPGLWLR